ncbi:putative glucan endo-1,3-beta-glucosidase ARB_02077 [Colletotrichum liriopes]|uniref:Glucan endo-1,3-beta-glucosidase ARB_02077 n=1 Tax=Colletotrichum liriopes TaxID=708192 RepID=A0AA37GQP2_9PEZI|nr:putative glucan endo-1,3-beta-glucosidase ARB_02077 [Colletotrichum liriopes]
MYAENGSGGSISDIAFTGGGVRLKGGSQQFTAQRLTCNGCTVGVQVIWDWGWVWKSVTMNNVGTGFQLVGDGGVGNIGSVSIVDSTFTGVTTAVLVNPITATPGQSSTGINLEKVALSGVSVAVADTTGATLLASSSVIDSGIVYRLKAATLSKFRLNIVYTNAYFSLNPREDCADGTCYEGACAGDAVFTTNGKCGSQHGYKQCAGVWGDCCNAIGECGTGADYCGYGVCQLGNCTIPSAPSGPPSWLKGNTTDGTCGGANSFTCNVVYGNCCNKDGMCGSLPSDCGAGW